MHDLSRERIRYQGRRFSAPSAPAQRPLRLTTLTWTGGPSMQHLSFRAIQFALQTLDNELRASPRLTEGGFTQNACHFPSGQPRNIPCCRERRRGCSEAASRHLHVLSQLFDRTARPPLQSNLQKVRLLSELFRSVVTRFGPLSRKFVQRQRSWLPTASML